MWISSTCRNVTIDPSIQLSDCPSRARPHPHQEMLIVIHVQIARVDSATASVLWNLIEIGWLVMAVQTVLVRCPGNVGLLQIPLQWIFEKNMPSPPESRGFAVPYELGISFCIGCGL